MHVDLVEAVWFALNAGCLVVTLIALVDARRDQNAVARINGRARKLVTAGNVRREFLRAVVQVLLIVIVIPGLFVDVPIRVTPLLLALMAVPVVLLLSSLYDYRDRRALNALADEIAAQRAA